MNISKILNILLAVGILVLLFKMNTNKAPKELEENKIEKVDNSKIPTTLDIIHKRKSVRSYTDQKVSKKQLETLVRAGMAAPTAVNKQPWAFIAIDDKETLNKLSEKLLYAQMLKEASSAIIVCGDLNKALKGKAQEFWIQDCSAATQNILLAAEAIGLGAVWTAAYPLQENMDAIHQTMNYPKHIVPLCVISIGYPTGKDKPKDKWKPENLHWQKW